MDDGSARTRLLPALVIGVLFALLAFAATIGTEPLLLGIVPPPDPFVDPDPLATLNRHLALRNWIAQPIIAAACGLIAGFVSRAPAWLLGMAIGLGSTVIPLTALPHRVRSWEFLALYTMIATAGAAAASWPRDGRR